MTYGLKIKNIEASTLYEYNASVRDHYECKDAMFVNSLFKDYLEENGLNTRNNESTRDIICLEFNYGTRSYSQELDHLHKIEKKALDEYKEAQTRNDSYVMEKIAKKRQKIAELLQEAEKNKEKYTQISKEELRRIFYNNGVQVEYISRDRKRETKKREVFYYKMLYRSTGKAKKGSCVFIVDRLYKKAKDFLYMGIKLPENNAPIVEISAYAPLVSSGIIDRIKINPENILILKDVDRFFKTNVVSVETDEQKHCFAERVDDYELKNTLFDGQALIDSGIFPSWANGYILLRHHFCKMAAFNTNIQQFFRDYFGENYSSATVKDMFGNEHFVKDIKLITTDNAMKYLKFDVSYEYWCDKVHENGCMFGIVKTAHRSKLGNRQRMSYQMVNSLDAQIMDEVCRQSVEYVNKLKSDDKVFLEYLKENTNFSNDYEVLIALCEYNRDFVNSSYFRERKYAIIKAYTLKLKSGEITQYAENLTVVGSPYAMLLYATCGDEKIVDEDDTFSYEQGTIQCYTERFPEGEYLAFFRSPFNSKNNLSYLHNRKDERMRKYFNLGQQIIAVNLIGTDFQDRNNGSDQDSDFGYTTNQPEIVRHAKKCYQDYPTIVNNIPKEKTVYRNVMDDYAAMDNGLANSQSDIGESSNLAQIAQTYEYNFENKKFSDYVCILSVLAQCAIDNSKRRFDIDIAKEIKRIKEDMDIKTHKYPEFWKLIKKGSGTKNINDSLQCPMNYLYDLKMDRFRKKASVLPISDFIRPNIDDGPQYRTCKKVEEFITEYSLKIYKNNLAESEDEDYLLLRSDFEDLVASLRKLKISNKYYGLFLWLLDRAFSEHKFHKIKQTNIKKNRSLLLKILYQVNPKMLLECFYPDDASAFDSRLPEPTKNRA